MPVVIHHSALRTGTTGWSSSHCQQETATSGILLDGYRFTDQYDHIGNRITATTGAPDLVASYATTALNQYAQITTPQTELVRGTAQGAASVTVNGQAPALGADGRFNARVTGGGPATIVATATDGSTATETRTVAIPPPTFSPQYDADGNLLNDGLWTYTWDGENRLIALESAFTNPMPERIFKRFSYDFQSRRISEERHVFDPTAGTGTGGTGAYVLEKAIRWVNDGWNQSVELLNDRPIRAYVWGLDLSGTRDGAGGVGGLLSSVDLLDGSGWDYLYDGNGNVEALTGSGGVVVGRYEYALHGEQLGCNGPAALINRFRFSSKMGDFDTGQLYYGYRYLDVRSVRWLSRDPIAERGGINVYGMVANDAVNRWDYLGLSPIDPGPCGNCGVTIYVGHNTHVIEILSNRQRELAKTPNSCMSYGSVSGVPGFGASLFLGSERLRPQADFPPTAEALRGCRP